MGMSNQHYIELWQIFDAHARMPQAFQHKQPAGKIRINQNALSAQLKEEAGVPDEGDSQVALDDGDGLVALAGAAGQSGMPYDTSELAGLSSQSDIEHELFELDAQKSPNDAACGTFIRVCCSILIRILGMHFQVLSIFFVRLR